MPAYYILPGFDINTPDGSLLLCSVDLPAQSKLLNMKQYNGKHGCHICEGEGVTRATSHLHRNWPYTTPGGPLRSYQSIAIQAAQNGGAVRD